MPLAISTFIGVVFAIGVAILIVGSVLLLLLRKRDETPEEVEHAAMAEADRRAERARGGGGMFR